MNVEDIRQVSVIGTGPIGHSIALGLRMAGYDISLHSRTEESLRKRMEDIKADLQRFVENGMATRGQTKSAINKIGTTVSPDKAVELFKEKMARGELGAKTGKGFYEWTPDSAEAARQKMAGSF